MTLSIWAAELGKPHVGFWPHAGEIAGLALIALGILLGVAVVRGWWLPGGFRQVEPPVLPSALEPRAALAVNSAEWEALCYPGSEVLIFELKHRFESLGAYQSFNERRCIVTDPDQITTEATGTPRIHQYPEDFPNARPVRPGCYRSEWQGRLSNGKWVDITSGEHQIQGPNLLVTILEDSQFVNFRRLALIAALHVQVENTTGMSMDAIGYADQVNGDAPWATGLTDEEKTSVKREISRLDETQQYGLNVRYFRRIAPHKTVSGWLLIPVKLPAAGGSPAITVIVRDAAGDQYQVTLPEREPQTYG